ncbi:MAG TPA: DUF2231 domain-containing protein [Polyangiaceae bacterium]|jgi:uncharacterized membrane protein
MGAPTGLRVFGHPAHAMLSHFPMALLLVVPLWDAAGIACHDALLRVISFQLLVAGLVAASFAAVAGLVDYAAMIEGAKRGTTTAARHLVVMIAAVGVDGVAAAIRVHAAPLGGGRAAVGLALEALAAVGLMAGGWLGGELVFRHGAGHVVVSASSDERKSEQGN